MGDRVQVQVKDAYDGSSVYFYSHSDGWCMDEVVGRAIADGEGRWGDTPYLARIIFSRMIKDDLLSETGYGISATEIDGRMIVVDDQSKSVSFDGKSWINYRELKERYGKSVSS